MRATLADEDGPELYLHGRSIGPSDTEACSILEPLESGDDPGV